MKVSFNSQDITPTEPDFFSGYSRSEKNKGVHDPILLNLLSIFSKEYHLYMFSVDLLNVQKEFSDRVTMEINRLYPNANNIVVFSAIHTHSGPAVFDLPSLSHPVNKKLATNLFNSALNLVKVSQTCSSEIDSILLEQGKIEGIYGNRNNQEGYSDKSFLTLKFIKDGKNVAALVNLACHPTILKAHNLLFSTDLFGVIRTELSEAWQCPVILFNGACGDISSRYFSKDSSFEEVQKQGSEIARAIIKPDIIKEITLDLISYSNHEEVNYYDAKQDEFWLEKVLAIEKSDNQLMKNMLTYHLDNKFNKISKQTTLLSKQLIFGDLVILTFSGEVVSEFERYIRSQIEGPVIIICYEHDYISYMVDEAEYGEYFESYVSRLEKGVADKFVKKVVDIVNSR